MSSGNERNVVPLSNEQSRNAIGVAAFDASPNAMALLDRSLVIIGANKAYCALANKKREQLLGKPLSAAFPPESGSENDVAYHGLKSSIRRSFETGITDTLVRFRYGIFRDTSEGTVFEERYWDTVNAPVLSDDGKVMCVLNCPVDVTEAMAPPSEAHRGNAEPDFTLLANWDALQHNAPVEQVPCRLDDEHARLRRVFQQAPGFISIVIGPEHVYDIVNDSYYQLVGQRDLIGRSIRQALPELNGQGYFELFDQVFSTGKPFVGRQMHIRFLSGEADSDHRKAREQYIDFVLQPLVGVDGGVTGIFAEGHDVTEQRRAQQALEMANERLRFAIEGSRDGIWDWNLLSGETSFSRRWKEILGFADEEISNRFEEWETRVHPEDRAVAIGTLQSCLHGEPYYNEHRLLAKNGKWKWVLARATVVSRNGEGMPNRVTGTLTDISEKKESEELIWRHASFDALTGLPNRRVFRDRLEREIFNSRQLGRKLALLFLNLDRFKHVNNLLGHRAGDRLLIEVAMRILSCVDHADTVARIGGDEFAVILTGLSNDMRVSRVLDEILHALQRPMVMDGEYAYVSASIGVSQCPEDTDDIDELIRNADQAMYSAKMAGRNQFRYFTPFMQQVVQKRVRLSRDLHHALAGNQLEVHFQPIVDLKSGWIAKAEALIRWRHPVLGYIPPTEFIPLAEESGLIHPIGDWLFVQVVKYAKRWKEQISPTLELSLNRSPVQFNAAYHNLDWEAHLKENGLSPDSITAEITEGTLLNSNRETQDTLLRYRDAGIQVALDDFGTGYSSLSYLLRLHIDYLKIDQSFVRDISENPTNRTIVKSMIRMAQELGLKVISEGIETKRQETVLKEIGCDYGQGYFYSRPIHPMAFEALLVAQCGRSASKPPKAGQS